MRKTMEEQFAIGEPATLPFVLGVGAVWDLAREGLTARWPLGRSPCVRPPR